MNRHSVRLAWTLAAALVVLGGVLIFVRLGQPNDAETADGPATDVATSTIYEDPPVTGAGSESCSGQINTPGGPDPWGGCWPGPSNTGVPTGANLRVITGDLTLSDPGYVLENTEVRGCISLTAEANNVTIRNVRVKANCSYLVLNDAGAQGLTIVDSELDGNSFPSSDAGIAGNHYTLTRVDIHGTGDGVKGGSDVLIEDSYIHDLYIANDSHNDALQALDATGLKIRHSTAIVKDGATSCIIFSQNGDSDWEIRNVEISRNLFAGGAYVIYGGYQTGVDDPSRVANIAITDNRISTSIFPRGGAYGALTSADPPAVVHHGNLWADGPDSGQSID